jgi:hypothetical protein
MKRMETYTVGQLAKLEEQRRILLNHQIEVEKDLVLKRQQLNQQVCLISSRVAALQKREQALNEREAALSAESERLRKSQQELLALVQSRVQPPGPAEAGQSAVGEPSTSAPPESALAAQVEPVSAGSESVDQAHSAEPTPTESHKDAHQGDVPVKSPTPAVAPASTTAKRPDPIAPTRVLPGHQAVKASAQKREARGKSSAVLRRGNPVSVSVIPAGEDTEPSPGWVVARSAAELHVLTDEAVEVGSILTVRPTKAAIPFPGVPVKVIRCHQERNQWVIECQTLQKLSGAFLQLFG